MSASGFPDRSSGGKKKKSKKATPFWNFFLKRVKEIEAEEAGKEVAGGGRVEDKQTHRTWMMDMVGREWQDMTPDQRAKYCKEQKNATNDGTVLHNSFGMAADAIHQAHWNKVVAHRDKNGYMIEIVEFYKKKQELAEMPIVICQFGTYAQTVVNGVTRALPSEMAMVAFTMRKGIMYNFCTLIDPGENGKDEFYDKDIKLSCEKQKLFINFDKKLQDYKAIVKQMDHFLSETVKAKVVFCNQKEIDVTAACIEWLCERAGTDASRYEILSLPCFVVKYSMEARKIAQEMEGKVTISQEVKDGLELKEKLVGGIVVYPFAFPWIQKQGIFSQIDQVEKLFSWSNYAHYPEIACSYHMEIEDGCQFCPLSIANRYAIVLMDALIRHFADVIPLVGKHYPRVNDFEQECADRREMLQIWNKYDFVQLGQQYKEEQEEEEFQKRQRELDYEAARLLANKCDISA